VRHQWSEVNPQLGSDLNGKWVVGAGLVALGRVRGQGGFASQQLDCGVARAGANLAQTQHCALEGAACGRHPSQKLWDRSCSELATSLSSTLHSEK